MLQGLGDAPLLGVELAILLGLLDEPRHRIVTLTGPGGVGKTRLAIAAASTLLNRFDGRIWFVPLAPVQADDLVLGVEYEEFVQAGIDELKFEMKATFVIG